MVNKKALISDSLKNGFKNTEQLFKDVPCGLCMINRDLSVAWHNKEFARLFGVSSKKEAHKKCSEIFCSPRCNTANCCLKQIIKQNKKRIKFKYSFVKNNKKRIYVVTVVPARDRQKKVIGIIKEVRDITEKEKIEEQLRLHGEIVTHMNEGVYLVGANNGIIYYNNPEFERMFGYNLGEMIGKHVSIVNAPTKEDPKKTAKRIMSAIKKNGEWHGEIENIKKDRTHFWSRANVSLFNHLRYGEVFISVHTDITEKKKMEEKLKESEEKYRTLVETTPDCVKIFNNKGNIEYINRGGLKEHRLKNLKEALDMNWQTIETIIKEDRPKFKKALREAFKGKVSISEIRHTQEGATRDACSEIIAPIKDVDGKIRKVFGISRDISIQKRAEKILKESKEDLELKVNKRTKELEETHKKLLESEKLASLGKMSSAIAHELRNPLGVIRLAVYSLKKKIGNDYKLIKHLNNIDKKVIESDQIIHDLLAFSRAVELKKNIGHISASIEKSLEDLKQKHKLKGIKMIKNIDSKIPNIKADFNQLSEVFYNLIMNSIDAVKEQDKKEIKIKAGIRKKYSGTDKEKDYIFVEISDTGIGIKKENVEKLGTPFFSTKVKGIGLGLYIVDEILKRHGGFVKTKSRVGKGSVFTINLPIK